MRKKANSDGNSTTRQHRFVPFAGYRRLPAAFPKNREGELASHSNTKHETGRFCQNRQPPQIPNECLLKSAVCLLKSAAYLLKPAACLLKPAACLLKSAACLQKISKANQTMEPATAHQTTENQFGRKVLHAIRWVGRDDFVAVFHDQPKITAFLVVISFSFLPTHIANALV